MTDVPASERVETIVVGGGQAGLVVGYHLARLGKPFVILDANERIGDSWRKRWDSLRLFSPRQFSGLAGLPFPGDPRTFPTKDEVADYLQEYATRFALPVRNGTRVDRLVRNGDGFTLTANGRQLEADNVVVAMATHQVPRVPAFATGSTRRSCRCIQRSTGTPRSSGTATSSSWEPATRVQRSPSTSRPAIRAATPHCSPEMTTVMSHFGSRRSQPGCCSFR